LRDLAPDITRQRLLVEGYFTIDVARDVVAGYLTGVAAHLGLRTYGEAMVHSPDGDGRPENQGFDAFIPLIDSGISLYVWSEQRFYSALLYTCKRFAAEEAVAYTKAYFGSERVESRTF